MSVGTPRIRRRRRLTALSVASALAFVLPGIPATAGTAPAIGSALAGHPGIAAAGQIVNISGACAGQNAEAEEATVTAS